MNFGVFQTSTVLAVVLLSFILLPATGFSEEEYPTETASYYFALSNGVHDQVVDRANMPYKEQFFPGVKGTKGGNFLLDTSHGAYFDFAPSTQFSSMISTLQSWGFSVTVAADFANLMSYDVVMLSLPQVNFSSGEIQLVANYLNAGKILILQGEWGTGTPWHNIAVNGLLSALNTGITVQSSMVYELVNYYVYTYWDLIYHFSTH